MELGAATPPAGRHRYPSWTAAILCSTHRQWWTFATTTTSWARAASSSPKTSWSKSWAGQRLSRESLQLSMHCIFTEDVFFCLVWERENIETRRWIEVKANQKIDFEPCKNVGLPPHNKTWQRPQRTPKLNYTMTQNGKKEKKINKKGWTHWNSFVATLTA